MEQNGTKLMVFRYISNEKTLTLRKNKILKKPMLSLTLQTTGTAFYQQDAFWIITVMVSIMCFLITMYVYLRRRFAREIAYRKKLAHSYERELDTQQAILERTKEELERVKKQIEAYKTELKEKERLLEEKIAQNKSFMKLLHQTEMEGNARDIVNAVRMASEGKHTMSDADWKMLLHAIDELYPTFNDTLIRKLGKIDRQELRVCCLIRIGLTNPQIQNIMNLPRTTVWRWVRKYDWITTMP